MGERLIDRFMPVADLRKVHEIRIGTPPEQVLAVAESFDLESLTLVHLLFRVRAWLLGARSAPRSHRGLLEEMTAIGWATLAVEPGRQRVVGAVTRPWEAEVRFVPIPPERFLAFSEPGQVKIVWTLEAEPDPLRPGGSLFRTETRVQATDEDSRRRFRRYYRMFGAGIVLIRRVLLPAVRRECEKAAPAGTGG